MTDINVRPPRYIPVRPSYHGPVSLWEIGALALLFGVNLLTLNFVDDQGGRIVNIVGPIAFSLILAGGVARPAMRDPNLIWTPLFWFRVAAAVYFGFGNVVPFIVDDQGARAIASYFAQYTDLITKLNTITALGVMLVLAAAYLVDRYFYRHERETRASEPVLSSRNQERELAMAGTTFLVVGLVIKFGFVLPLSLGTSSKQIPGIFTTLALLSDAGIYLLSAWAWRYRPNMVFLPFALAAIEVFFGLLEFNKSEVIAPLLVLALGWLSKGVTIRRVLVATGLLALAFATSIPFVGVGRDEMLRRYQGLGGADISERIEIASHYFEDSTKKDDDNQVGLLRLSYTAAATFAMSMQDSGSVGYTLDTLPASFIPRVLWPDKPNMTEIAGQFNEMATGNAESASAPGWIAESYWDYGWFGPFIVMIPAGIIMQVWSAFALKVMSAGRWFYFPLCLLGMRAAVAVDGFVVTGLIGPMTISLAVYVALRIAGFLYDRAGAQPALSDPQA